jgi:two-component system response regulator AdeR
MIYPGRVLVVMRGPPLTVLIVDEEPGIRDLWSVWLDDHTVRTASDGEEALSELDADVDLVLLDRIMPGPSGVTVAERIADGPHDPHVVMISSLEPDFDIADFPIDGYLNKPITEDGLLSIIEQLLKQDAYQAAFDEFFSATARLATIQAEFDEEELDDCVEYGRLKERVAKKRAEVDAALATTDLDWSMVFNDCQEEGSAGSRHLLAPFAPSAGGASERSTRSEWMAGQ